MAPGLPGLRDHQILPLCQPELRSAEHTSELQHLGISYAVFCLKKKVLQLLFAVPELLDASALGAPVRLDALPMWRAELVVSFGQEKCRAGVGDAVCFFLNGGRPPNFPLFPSDAPLLV